MDRLKHHLAGSVRILAAAAACCLWLLSGASDVQAQAAPLPCTGAAIELSSGDHVLNTSCVVSGPVTLSGTARLFVTGSTLLVDGHVNLSGAASLMFYDAVLILDNQLVLQHRIEARDTARINFIKSILITNIAKPGNSLASQYVGRGHSVLAVSDSQIFLPDSWLLADLQDQAILRTTNSTNFPSEIYPHGESTVVIEGPTADHRIWLEFLGDAQVLLEELPDTDAPFNFSFGRNSPGVIGVGYQVEVLNGIATFGIASHPGSRVSLVGTEAPIAIGYFLNNLQDAETVSAIGPTSRDIILNNQGRVFELHDANLFEFAWQLYTASPAMPAARPVSVTDSVINELAADVNGHFVISESLLQWAVVAAVGADSVVEIRNSTINSQSIFAKANGTILIDSSNIFGALIEASDDAMILLTNVNLEPNVCHALCLPVCPSAENGGFEDGRCNPFNPPGAESLMTAADNGVIAALRLGAVDPPTTPDALVDIPGDLFVETGPNVSRSFTYRLRYRHLGTAATGIIVDGAQGPVRDSSLALWDTLGLAAGDYQLVLELHQDGQPIAGVLGLVSLP